MLSILYLYTVLGTAGANTPWSTFPAAYSAGREPYRLPPPPPPPVTPPPSSSPSSVPMGPEDDDGSGVSSTSRARGGRRRNAQYGVDVIFLNSSGGKQADDLLADLLSPPKPPLFEKTNRAVVVCVAEHHYLPEEWEAKSHTWEGRGWQSGGAPGVRTDKGGASAGVFFATPKPNLFAPFEVFGSFDCSPLTPQGASRSGGSMGG